VAYVNKGVCEPIRITEQKIKSCIKVYNIYQSVWNGIYRVVGEDDIEWDPPLLIFAFSRCVSQAIVPLLTHGIRVTRLRERHYRIAEEGGKHTVKSMHRWSITNPGVLVQLSIKLLK